MISKNLSSLLFILYLISFPLLAIDPTSKEITPYKFTDEDCKNGLPKIDIPTSSRFTIKRLDTDAPNIVFYFSTPKRNTFPIVFLCGGSSSKENITSIIHVHRYFLKEFLDLGIAVLTVEQRGVDGNKVEALEFMKNYTRSKRLHDHQTVIEHLKSHPPKGWNGKLIFLGVSEGGPIVTTLTEKYSNITIATINWSGAGDWSWREELWVFIRGMKNEIPWHIKLRMLIPKWLPFSIDLSLPPTRQKYDKAMDQALESPAYDKEFMGMTYAYHSDAQTYPSPNYLKIRTPFLVVAGVLDTIIHSSDAFVHKAEKTGAPITYMRISDMDHYVRRRPDIIQKSFEWLKEQLATCSTQKKD